MVLKISICDLNFLEMINMNEKNSFKEFICSGAGKAGMIIVLYAIIFLLMGVLPTVFADATYAPLIVALVLAIFGWKALNKIQPNIFLFMPLIGWVIYFFVKGCLAIVVGTFVAPFVIARSITNYVQNSMSKEQ